ncbi:MAG TPA: hypothetical protein PLE50_10270 [Rhabdaerophilum sp.]|nr:hypothetical protein [Rhabdaerophilum sp.]
MAADPHRWADLRRLLTETGRRYLPRYILALALLGVVSATTAATAWLMKDVINEVFIAKSQSALIFVAVAVLVIYVARGAASYGQGVILAKIGNACPRVRSGSFPRCSRGKSMRSRNQPPPNSSRNSFSPPKARVSFFRCW